MHECSVALYDALVTSTMRAAVYYGSRDIRVLQVPRPIPKPGEVLVRVLRNGLCGTDATEWAHGPVMIPLHEPHPHSHHVGPMILGHEIVGEVVTAPEGSGLTPGMLAASGAQVACGHCRNCREGRINVCDRLWTLGLQADGGHLRTLTRTESGSGPFAARTRCNRPRRRPVRGYGQARRA